MFGEKIDYLILRCIAHRSNIATEHELNVRYSQVTHRSLDEAILRLQKYIERFAGSFPISDELRYLDMGCGTGELTLALAKMGCKQVTGIDFVDRNIAKSKLHASQAGLNNTVQFICQDMNRWIPTQKYDVLLSFEAFEHIDNPREFLQKMDSFIAPKGICVLAFGPLFHSPFGDHMSSFFRVQIPWRGILFSEKAMLRVRREFYRPTDAANRYEDIVGGLNLLRYSEFLNYVHETGWDFSFLAVNPFLKRLPPFHFLSHILTRIPIVKDFFVHNVYAILRRSS